LFRIAKARGDFLGKVQIFDLDQLTDDSNGTPTSRSVYLPLDHADGSNPRIPLEEPLPGVFIYRVRQNPLYPSVGSFTDQLVAVVQRQTKRTNPLSYPRLGDRPWNLPGPRHLDLDAEARDPRPTLKAIIMDFDAVDHIDVTAVLVLQDIRAQLDRHASPDIVEWHFAGIRGPWVKRALVSGGFGRIQNVPGEVRPMYSIARIGDSSDDLGTRSQRAAELEKWRNVRRNGGEVGADDVEATGGFEAVNRAVAGLPVLSIDREAFHLDVPAAVASVESRLGPGAKPLSRPDVLRQRTPSDSKSTE